MVRSDEGGIAADNYAPEHVTVKDSVQRVLFLPLTRTFATFELVDMG